MAGKAHPIFFFLNTSFRRTAILYNERTFSSSKNPFATRKKEATLMSHDLTGRQCDRGGPCPSSALHVFEFRRI